MAKDRDNTGVSKADLARGYTDAQNDEALGVPPRTAPEDSFAGTLPGGLNPARAAYDPETNTFRDRFGGGFLPRDGYSTER